MLRLICFVGMIKFIIFCGGWGIPATEAVKRPLKSRVKKSKRSQKKYTRLVKGSGIA